MATFNSDLVVKKLRHRGLHMGREQNVTGGLYVAAGGSIALTDLIQMVPLGENTRPIRITINSTPLSGTPVLTNPTFSIGVTAIGGTFTRPDGSAFPAVTTSATILSAATALANNTKTFIEIPRPAADSVSKYGPLYVTLTPAGAGAFSVSGGDILLQCEVTFLGEKKDRALVYEEFLNQKVK